jgi:hypothetical protein
MAHGSTPGGVIDAKAIDRRAKSKRAKFESQKRRRRLDVSRLEGGLGQMRS